jgi:hypothetical protein
MFLAFFLYTSLIISFLIYTYYESHIVNSNDRTIVDARSIVQIYPIIIFTIIVGFRYQVGGDFPGYEGYFNEQINLDNASQVPYELGFFLLIELLHFIHLPSQALFVITAFIQVLLLTKIIRISRGCGTLVILFYFLSLSFIESLNTLRQSIALLAVIISVYQYREGNLKSFIIYALLGLAFHLSTIVAIPIIVISSFINVHRIRLFISVMLLIIIFFSGEIADFILSLLPMLGALGFYNGYLVVREDLIFEASASGGFGLYISVMTDFYLIYRGSSLIAGAHYPLPKYLFSAFVFGALFNPIAVESGFMTFSRGLMYLYGLKFIIMGCILFIGYKEGNKYERTGLLMFSLIMVYLLWFYSAVLSGAAHSAPYYFYDFL